MIFVCADEAGCSLYGPDSDENLATYGDLYSWQAGTCGPNTWARTKPWFSAPTDSTPA